MGLPELIESAVAIVQSIAGPLRAPVTHTPVVSQGAFGPEYGNPVDRLAIIEEEARGITTGEGTTAASKVKLTFLEGITTTDRDTFKLPDGREYFEMITEHMYKPDGITPYQTTVWIGEAIARG